MDLFFSLNGRIGRGKWWLGFLVLFIAQIIFSAIMVSAGLISPDGFGVGLFYLIFAVIFLWPSICLHGKRFHDRDKSAWWVLVSLIPLIGALWILIECGFLVGTRGENRFGPDPIER